MTNTTHDYYVKNKFEAPLSRFLEQAP